MSTTRKGLSRDEAQALCARVLSYATADDTRVNVDSGWRGYTRVATNRITSAGGSDNISVRVTSVFGKRVASVSTNRIDDASLADAVRKSEQLARLAPEDPEYMPELGPQEYSRVEGYYDTTGDLTTAARAEAAALAIEAARKEGFIAAGFMDVAAGSEAIANSRGLFAYHADTGVASTMTVRTPSGDSSGWAGGEASEWDSIDSAAIALRATTKCADWRNKTTLEPGKYTAILEPTATGMLLSRLRGDLDARSADEGRSYFSNPDGTNKIGEKLFHELVTIRSDPGASGSETASFTGAGEPVQAQTWIENGVLRNLSYSRYWGEKSGKTSLPGPSNLIMQGSGASLDDLIGSTERGVLITRFWYIRGLNPRTLSYTGLTRDGTFLIENGKIARPVTNFRFNQSIAEMLQNIEMLGTATRVCASENSSVAAPIVVPAMKVRDFNLASVSDAI